MSRILLLSYYFPPIGGAGAQRPAKFARYLYERGHDVVVLTGPGPSGGFWSPSDPTLSSDIPDGVEVVRIATPEPKRASRWLGRAQRMARIDDNWVRWWRAGIDEAAKSISDIDLVYTIMSPYSSAESSYALAQKFGVGWIADLGDPWALDEMMVYPTGIHRRLEIRQMRRNLGTASAIVMSTSEASRQLVERFPELAGRPVVTIPNGYDPADFEHVEAPPGPEPRPDAFRIVHTGYLHTEAGLQQRGRSRLRRLVGGGMEGVDILTRSHTYLVEAIERLLAADSGLADTIELHLAGVLTETDRRLAERLPVSILHGYVTHAESIALMRSADLLFLPMQNLLRGRRSSTVPGKTYEYLASARPILGAVPPGDAQDFLAASGRAHLCAPDDVDGMADALRKAIDRRHDPVPSEDDIERFSYERLAERVERLVHEVAASRRPPRAQQLADDAVESHSMQRDQIDVMLLAYYFPPVGGAGVQRSLKFARYLPENDCRLTVVTGPGTERGRWTPIDSSLNAEVPDETRIVRVAGHEPHPGRWADRIDRWLRNGSAFSRWWARAAYDAAAEIRDVDVIVASASPYATIDAAARLGRTLRRPWIADLRDPWALDEMEAYPTGLHRVLERRRMRRLLREASAIVMTTNEAVRQLLDAFPELCDRPVIAIPNGFDAADFLAADDASPEAGGDTFRIVHAGYLHTEAGLKQRRRSLLHKVLRGTVPGVDILTRTHLFLLAAITLLLEQDPSIGDCLELHLAGVISKLGIEFARTSPVTKIHGYVTHAQAIGLIKSADLLFLPMQNLTDGRRSSTVPGKTYEYLASGRPILGAVPPGDARDLLERSGHAVCAPDDVEGIAAHIRSAMLDHARHGRRPSDPSFGEAFERRELAGQLADLLWLVAGAEAGAVTRRSLSHA